ncbi:OSM-11 protein, partial [Aphelenchoides avenae]
EPQFDLPLPTGDQKASETFVGRPLQAHQISVAMIRTCTPDCTAPHCTTECKCQHSHAMVHTRCNPPSDSHMANVCQAWYAKCPMYKPLAY